MQNLAKLVLIGAELDLDEVDAHISIFVSELFNLCGSKKVLSSSLSPV